MSKIKEITDRIKIQPEEYTNIRFLIAKRTVAFFLMIYYLSFLFSVGGFSFGPVSISMLAMITYHLYSVVAIVIAWFFYEVGVYADYVYFHSRKWPVYIISIITLIWLSITLFTHLSSSF